VAVVEQVAMVEIMPVQVAVAVAALTQIGWEYFHHRIQSLMVAQVTLHQLHQAKEIMAELLVRMVARMAQVVVVVALRLPVQHQQIKGLVLS